MAEAFFNLYSKNDKAISAGKEKVLVLGEDRMNEQIVKVMLEKGIDISKNKSKQVTKEMIDTADKIILMNPDLLSLFGIPKEKLEVWDIEDFSAPAEDNIYLPNFRKIRDLVEDKVKDLILKLQFQN